MRCGLLSVTLAGAALVLGAGRAEAHAYLVRTDPVQGARLSGAPEAVGLQFSEPVAEGGTTISLNVGGAANSQLRAERQSGGRVLRAMLVERQHGIYVVHWHVVADDDHESDGEFAFAVGAGAGHLPGPQQARARPPAVRVAASWLFFVGLALGTGGLATAVVVDRSVAPGSMGVRAGMLAATLGAAVVYILDMSRAGATTGGGTAAVGVVLALMCVACLLNTWAPRAEPALVATVAAGVAWSARGHAATAGGALGWAVDAVHLTAGAMWVGALAHLVTRLVRRRDSAPDALVGARAYARLALPLVGVLAVAGGVSALRLVPHWNDLWTSGYGRLIVAKSVLFAVALALAVVARWSGLGRAQLARLGRVAKAEAGATMIVLLLTAVLVNVAPPVQTSAAANLLGPEPLAGPVFHDAGLAGILTVAVAAGDGQLQVEVIPPDGPKPRARADMEAIFPDGRQASLLARPCGPGCFTQRLALPPGATRLSVAASAPGWKGGTFDTMLPSSSPSTRPELLSALVKRMRAVPRLDVTEVTSSGPDSVPAPAEIAVTGEQFIDAEPYASGVAEDIQPLDDAATGLRLYVAGDRIWVTMRLDPEGRIASERVVDVGHVIDRTFRYPPA